MKALKKAMVGIGIIAMAGFLYTTRPAYAVVEGGKHDFTDRAWIGSHGSNCSVCHTRHASKDPSVGAPLWNHGIEEGATWTMYDSETLDNKSPSEPYGVDRLCLSCHDGSVALDAIGSNPGGAEYAEVLKGLNADGTNHYLGTTHPISIDYDETKDTGLYPKEELASGRYSVRGLPLFDGKVSCASCHDIHRVDGTKTRKDYKSHPDYAGDARGSRCEACHNK